MAFVVRRLGPADAQAYQALRLAGLQQAPTGFSASFEDECNTPLAAIEAELAPGVRNRFGAFDGATLVGIVAVGRETARKLRHKAFIAAMVVEPDWRGRGVGRLLMEHAFAFAASLDGVRQVSLGVTAGNAAAIALYESLGFHTYGREPDSTCVDGTFYDQILMVRHVQTR